MEADCKLLHWAKIKAKNKIYKRYRISTGHVQNLCIKIFFDRSCCMFGSAVRFTKNIHFWLKALHALVEKSHHTISDVPQKVLFLVSSFLFLTSHLDFSKILMFSESFYFCFVSFLPFLLFLNSFIFKNFVLISSRWWCLCNNCFPFLIALMMFMCWFVHVIWTLGPP